MGWFGGRILGEIGVFGWGDILLNMSLRWPFRMHVLDFRSWPRNHFATAVDFGSGGPGVMGTCWPVWPWTCGWPLCCAAACC